MAAEDLGMPRAGAVYSRATSTSSQRYVIPPSWFGGYISIAAKGFELQVVFGDSTVAAAMDVDSTVSGTTTQTLTPAATTSEPIPADQERPFLLPLSNADNAPTHFAIIAAGGGRWFGYRAQNRGG